MTPSLPTLAVAAAVLLAGAPGPTAAQVADPSQATTVVAARAVPARRVLGPEDLAMAEGAGAGLASVAQAVGLETRVALYPGRPVRAEDLAPPALVDRNDLVTLSWRRGTLLIRVEARALDRGGLGQRVRAMNLDSRHTVTGRVIGPGLVDVGG